MEQKDSNNGKEVENAAESGVVNGAAHDVESAGDSLTKVSELTLKPENRRERRKRIFRPNSGTAVAKTSGDPLEYSKNKATENGRKSEVLVNNLICDLWHDQHYVVRYSAGDESGPRLGIEPNIVHEFIDKCFKHLMYYSSTVRNFAFVNDNGSDKRVVLMDMSKNPNLNVAIEVHFIGFLKYEVTVITAMCKNGFIAHDGQYILEYTGEEESVLRWKLRGRIELLGEIAF